MEVRSAEAVCTVVKSGVVVGAKRCGVQLAIAAGGRGVPSGPAPTKGGTPIGRSAVDGVRCYGCGKAGHLWKDCRAGGGSGPVGRPPFRCWGCGGVGHGISICSGRTLPVTSAAGVLAPVPGPEATGRGIKRGGGHLSDACFRGRQFRGGCVLGYLGGGARRVAAAP